MIEKRNISNKLFAELCSHFSNEINSPFEIRTFKKGGFIYRKGNQPKGVYFIKIITNNYIVIKKIIKKD